MTIETARQELNLLASRLAAQYPATNQGRRARLTPLDEFVGGPVRAALLTLLGAVGLLLLIACANVANLLLARAAGRTHEIAVRTALGASRARVIQQLLTESLLLSLTGGIGGLLLAFGGARLILKFAASQIPRAWEIGIDWRVFCFLLATCAVTGIAFGILPALAASRTDPQSALKQTSGNRTTGSSGRLRDALVVAEIALSFVLLAGAGLLMRGFLRLQDTPTGFVADNVLTLRLTASLQDYRAPGSYGRYLQELESRVKQTPGVRTAGFIQYLPLQNWGWTAFFSIPGRPVQPNAEPLRTELRYVSPGYFEALRIPLRRGRLFTDRDTAWRAGGHRGQRSPGTPLFSESGPRGPAHRSRCDRRRGRRRPHIAAGPARHAGNLLFLRAESGGNVGCRRIARRQHPPAAAKPGECRARRHTPGQSPTGRI